MTFDTVIWDWNGTLIDDVNISYDILNYLLKENGVLEIATIDDYRQIFGFPIIDYYKRAGFDFSKKSYEQLANDYIVQYAFRCKACHLHAGVVEVLTKIKQKGVRQVILSAAKQDVLLQQVDAFNIAHLFDEIVGIADIYATGKIEVARQWQAKTGTTNAVMIGDTLHDFEVANEISAKSILFTGGHHKRAQLGATGAIVVESLLEVLNYI